MTQFFCVRLSPPRRGNYGQFYLLDFLYTFWRRKIQKLPVADVLTLHWVGCETWLLPSGNCWVADVRNSVILVVMSAGAAPSVWLVGVYRVCVVVFLVCFAWARVFGMSLRLSCWRPSMSAQPPFGSRCVLSLVRLLA